MNDVTVTYYTGYYDKKTSFRFYYKIGMKFAWYIIQEAIKVYIVNIWVHVYKNCNSFYT